MPKTKAELATRALGIMGILEAGQTPSAEDLATVSALIDPLASYLGLVNVIYVGDTEDIDDAVFLPLAARLALEAAPDFGLPASDDETKLDAEKPLRRLAASRPSGRPAEVDYF